MVAMVAVVGGTAIPATAQQDLDCANFQFQEDAQEVLNADRSDPHGLDTDKDGIQDGTELGKTKPISPRKIKGTKIKKFRPDLDPKTKTNPLLKDTDGDGKADGKEDKNKNGRRDKGETNPLKK